MYRRVIAEAQPLNHQMGLWPRYGHDPRVEFSGVSGVFGECIVPERKLSEKWGTHRG